MKLITWNCQMAFRNKAENILSLNPDILIVPECECPEKLIFKKEVPIPTDVFWFGSNRNKGLGVFSYSDFKFELIVDHNTELKNILPLRVIGKHHNFTLELV